MTIHREIYVVKGIEYFPDGFVCCVCYQKEKQMIMKRKATENEELVRSHRTIESTIGTVKCYSKVYCKAINALQLKSAIIHFMYIILSRSNLHTNF